MKKRNVQHNPIPIQFPEADVESDQPYCAVCGSKRIGDGEFQAPNGTISCDVDGDLCLECGIHLWRAIKESHPENIRNMALEILRRYSVTRPAVEAFLMTIPQGPAQ